MKTINDVPMILRREIEARMIAPFLKAFSDEIGEEKTREITTKVIAELAGQQGREIAKSMGTSLMDIRDKVFPLFSKGGSVESECLTSSEKNLRIDVVKCVYADMYKRLGLEDLGFQLSCQRDEYLFEGMNPKIKFTRSKTIMEGCDCCDFHLDICDEEECLV